MKKKLLAKKGRWADELPGVLWAYRSNPRRPTGETPYSLVYEVEAILSIEHEIRTIRTIYANDHKETNDEMLRDSLDLIDEMIDQALARMNLYQRSIARYYNKGVNFREFDIEDLVLRKVYQNRAEENAKKL